MDVDDTSATRAMADRMRRLEIQTASSLQGDTARGVKMRRNKGMLIGGVALVAEGTALAMYGTRYLDFMDRHGLMDFGKRLLRRTGISSRKSLAAIGMAQAVVGLVLIDRMRRQRPAAA
jgi:hypothetical protein